MKIENRAGLSAHDLLGCEAEIGTQADLSDVLNWGRHPRSGVADPSVLTEVVALDEFSHEVLVRWRDGLVLAYRTT
ncbi:MAG: hypothetical protein HY049_10225 [Acidobacteria bacterium]|nr:hypothetical protein [Acidobacteriota bacterium]